MGHTVTSQRRVVDNIIEELSGYGKSLRQENQKAYKELLKQALKHIGNITYTSSIHVWAFVLMSIILEQQKKLNEIEQKYESMVDGLLQERELSCVMDENTRKRLQDT